MDYKPRDVDSISGSVEVDAGSRIVCNGYAEILQDQIVPFQLEVLVSSNEIHTSAGLLKLLQMQNPGFTSTMAIEPGPVAAVTLCMNGNFTGTCIVGTSWVIQDAANLEQASAHGRVKKSGTSISHRPAKQLSHA